MEDLGAPPDRGFGALGPSENTPNFLKTPLCGAGVLLSCLGAREKKLARMLQNAVRTWVEPCGFNSFWLRLLTDFPLIVHRLVQLSPEPS